LLPKERAAYADASLRMTRPVNLSIPDLNGDSHECVAEAFDTQHNVVILVYPVKALNTARILLP
jgi:hypothetical protein